MKLNFQIIMKNVSKLKVLDSKQYSVLDDFTGEVFKPKNSPLCTISNDNKLKLNSKRYYIIDENRLRYIILNRDISSNTLGALIVLTQNILQMYNICMDSNDKPFNAMRLSKELNMSPQHSRNHIRELIKHNILHEGVVKGKEELKKVLVINPYFIRKGSLLDSSLRGLFDDFCK
jgi:hypothetical protein